MSEVTAKQMVLKIINQAITGLSAKDARRLVDYIESLEAELAELKKPLEKPFIAEELLKITRDDGDVDPEAYDSELREGVRELLTEAKRLRSELAKRDAQMEKEAILDNRWIKIDPGSRGRLPTIDEDVFVWVNGKTEVGHICEEGIWWIERDGGYYPAQSKVTHWMPIPTGPEEDE